MSIASEHAKAYDPSMTNVAELLIVFRAQAVSKVCEKPEACTAAEGRRDVYTFKDGSKCSLHICPDHGLVLEVCE